MFGENGFRDYGADAAWLSEAQDRGHHMNEEDNRITHTRC